jgi:hypothetical protein
LVGLEWDTLVHDAATPASALTLSASPVATAEGPADLQNASIYSVGRSFVFGAGTIGFAVRLPADPRLPKMLDNVIRHAGAESYAP